ncbi:hypothetical protein PISMIDRAFT_10196 [Pisolithus microcarpus 441]|uniref:Uncharacterized protein n=1 Tax=Pisolithus microcarpus 441 TaxID=765257 RepID=A0A0C9Z608_9AGAM|nr:hypothetical protein PISMIDRAFT_10196 [Pisolithus microcarpus 441]
MSKCREQGDVQRKLNSYQAIIPLTSSRSRNLPPILKLIRKLASPFQARYGKAPTEAECGIFEDVDALVLNGQLREEALYSLPVHRYQLGIHRLSNSEWFLGTIKDALERPGWPAKDGVGPRLTTSTEGTARQMQRAERRVQAESVLVSASFGPLKRSVTSPPPSLQHKRSRLDKSEKRIARE